MEGEEISHRISRACTPREAIHTLVYDGEAMTSKDMETWGTVRTRKYPDPDRQIRHDVHISWGSMTDRGI
jgi:hypothetical protein